MTENHGLIKIRNKNLFLVALGVYFVSCIFGLMSRFIPIMFIIFVLFGILFPLLYAKFRHNWGSIGFSWYKIPQALFWGVLFGLFWSFYTLIIFYPNNSPTPFLGLQIAIGIPLWLLILSPFQEFFFRGYLQPRFQSSTGKWLGLIFTSLLFTLWHFFPQFEGTMTATLPLSSFAGIISIFLSGLIFGYCYQKTENIVAPWLAHALGGIALIISGQMVFMQYIP